MRVVFFHRRPRVNFNFSVENLFQQIRNALPSDIVPEVKQLSRYSEGILNRLILCLEATLAQGEVNHVTGDINFIAILLRKRRTVLTILDVGFMNHKSWFARWLLRWFWIVFPAKRSSLITTISHATKSELLKYVSIDPARIVVIYVPILPAFIPVKTAFNKVKPTLLQIGTKSNKNVIRLVKALRGVPCHLEIVGEVGPDLFFELHNASIDYSASMNLTNDEVVRKYVDCDLVCFVSTYEGFGMPIVEANATGRVVVTSNILSMPEVGGDAAHYVDPFDIESIRSGILKVIGDEKYRDELIENGFRNTLRFDVRSIAEQYAECYRRVLSR